MELPYSSEGIVLASDKYRESDRLLVIYTSERGKIRVISRGSRKMSSKLSPHLEPLDYVSLMLVNGKTLITLTRSSKIEDFKNLKSSGAYSLLALHLLELVNESVLENLPDDKIYKLLLDLLRYLNKNNEGEKKKFAAQEIIIAFKLKLLEFLGLRPEEIGKMPEVLKILEADFASLESIDWKKISQSPLRLSEASKLEKVLDYAFFDALGKPTISFDKYIR